ncbi:hypothetical protein ACWD4V_13960 [Streptomyces tsukubensis]
MTRTPQETFLSDQTLAAARHAAEATPGLLSVAITPANGEQCTWCDCPTSSDGPHSQPGYRCAGCPDSAKHVVSAYTGPDLRFDYPACRRHSPQIVIDLVETAGRKP